MALQGRGNRYLIVASIVFSLGLLEILTRAVFPLPEVLNFDRLRYSPNTLRVEEYASLGNRSFVWTSEPDEAESVHQLNLYGFRDRTWTLEKPRGTTRIAFVGDSMVEGFLSAADRTIPVGFKEASGNDSPPVEVLNFGIAAAGINQYLVLIRDMVPLFRTDHVIVVFYINDFHELPYDPAWRAGSLTPIVANPWAPRMLYVVNRLMRDGWVPRRWPDRPFPFLVPVPDPRNPWSDASNAATFETFVKADLADAMKRGRLNPYLVNALRNDELHLNHWIDPTPFLTALDDFTSELQATLWVVYLPSRNQVADHYVAYELEYSLPAEISLMGERSQIQARRLTQICGSLDIPFLDLTPILRSREAEGHRLYWNYDGHMNGDGYLFVGRAIHQWWSRTRALP